MASVSTKSEPEREGQIRSYIEGLRWVGLRQFVYGLAVTHGLEIDSLTEDKGLLRSTVYFTVSGFESDLLRFKKDF